MHMHMVRGGVNILFNTLDTCGGEQGQNILGVDYVWSKEGGGAFVLDIDGWQLFFMPH